MENKRIQGKGKENKGDTTLTNIIRQMKSRRMRWTGNVVHVGEERKVNKVLVGKDGGQRPLRRLRYR
jgi:hypothetical protein